MVEYLTTSYYYTQEAMLPFPPDRPPATLPRAFHLLTQAVRVHLGYLAPLCSLNFFSLNPIFDVSSFLPSSVLFAFDHSPCIIKSLTLFLPVSSSLITPSFLIPQNRHFADPWKWRKDESVNA